jgi:hypothetical protein
MSPFNKTPDRKKTMSEIEQNAEPTPLQLQQMEECAAHWRKIGECSDKADLERCKVIIPEVYRAAGVIPPQEIILADGPVAAARLCRRLDQEVDRHNLGRETREYVSDQVYGSHDAPWLAFYSYFLEYCGMKVCEPLKPLMDLAKHCGWWSPYDTRAIVQHRCTRYMKDAEDRLHAEDGPSVEWPDGTKLWDIHGIEVNEQIVMRPETQTVQQILSESNGDVRAIRIERFGWPRFLYETKAECIDNRKNEVEGTLEALYRSPTGELRLVATCPTGRVFTLPLDGRAPVTTCEQAQVWLASGRKLNVIGRS